MKKSILIFLIVLLFITDAYAQGGPPPPDGGGGPGTVFDVSIHFLVYPFLLLGAFIGVRFFSKTKA